jgi:hypothetical protein
MNSSINAAAVEAGWIDIFNRVITEICTVLSLFPVDLKNKKRDELQIILKDISKTLTKDHRISWLAFCLLRDCGFVDWEYVGSPMDSKKSVNTEALVQTTMEDKITFFTPLIQSGKYTLIEILQMAEDRFPNLSPATLRTFLTDSKNPKYNKFSKLVVVTEGRLNFKSK